MSFKELELHSSYESLEDNEYLLNQFYIPVLEQTVNYYRIAGFFSSTALTVAMEGIEGLIHNKGKMYLLVSPELSASDYKTIKEYGQISANSEMFDDLDIDDTANDHIKALAWLLANDYLEIKIVVGEKSANSLFHQKFGIFEDAEGDKISFSGSINETAQAWLNNIEEFKVFRSWKDGQKEYLNSDCQKFIDYWNDNKPGIAKVYDIPEAIRKRIVHVKPENINDLSIMKKYVCKSKKEEGLSLFPHQKAAVEKWKNNNRKLLVEMATGTGKTRTAIGCVYEMLKNGEKFITIVATPQTTLSQQWNSDIKELDLNFDVSIFADSTNPKWKNEFKSLLLKFWMYKSAIVYTTHDTASSKYFIECIKKYRHDTKIFFICDEVHAIGSLKQREALLDDYDYRIGLSATPERLYDEEGTGLTRKYFGNQSFEFTIYEALHTINPITGKYFLNQYNYYPRFVHLNDEETSKCKKINRQISIIKSIIEGKKKRQVPYAADQKKLEGCYNTRANIDKNAVEKIGELQSLLKDLNPELIQDTIIFTTDKQINDVMEMLGELKISRAKITEEISARSSGISEISDRQKIIKEFAEGMYRVVVGIKCLDEGIDIKTARIAVLMASSTNPREYIQRVGRVIRPAPNKKISEIFDFIVLDEDNKPLLLNEEKRVSLIARNANNYEDVHRIFMEKGVDLDAYK
jgi:superfamily II DNA or RNA helicase